MRLLFLLLSLSLLACHARRRGPPPVLFHDTPQCAVALPAPRVTTVVCRGSYSREQLWGEALKRAALTGPQHMSLTFNIETTEAPQLRNLTARFVGAGEPAGTYDIEKLAPPAELEAARLAEVDRTCKRATTSDGYDAATRASCLQYLASKQQMTQTERHHQENVAMEKAANAPPECRMGSDGINSCGYNCELGSNGHWYCASRPGWKCAFNSDGSWTCP